MTLDELRVLLWHSDDEQRQEGLRRAAKHTDLPSDLDSIVRRVEVTGFFFAHILRHVGHDPRTWRPSPRWLAEARQATRRLRGQDLLADVDHPDDGICGIEIDTEGAVDFIVDPARLGLVWFVEGELIGGVFHLLDAGLVAPGM